RGGGVAREARSRRCRDGAEDRVAASLQRAYCNARLRPPTMTFKDHFSRLSPGYAEYRPHYPEALFDHFASLCTERRLAWDCACGSGQASVSLAARFERVVATDASAEQIEAAAPHPRVEYRVAAAERSGLDTAS